MKKITLLFSVALILAACTNSPTAQESPADQSAETIAVESEVVADTTTEAAPEANTYTLAQVSQHATPEDCWLVIDGKVYDVSGFGEKHGGGEAVYQGCGIDATELFETRPMGSGTPHSDKARSFLPNFEIGTLTTE